MIPLRDANPTRRTPVVTLALIGASFAAWAVELAVETSGGPAALAELFGTWGAVPSRISAALDGSGDAGAAALGVLGSLFLHGGWLHLLGNMLFLWIFGNNIEDRLGRASFIAFYLVGGVAAALTQVWVDPDLGESGGDAPHQVERQEPRPPEPVLDVVPEDPQEQHVPEQVQPAAVEEEAQIGRAHV